MEYLHINSQIQIEISRVFKKSKFKKIEGFYDPRIGMIFIADFSGYLEEKPNSSESERLERKKDRLEEKLKKITILLRLQKYLKENERIIFGIYSKDGYRLEVWKKEALQKLEYGKNIDISVGENGYFVLMNGKNPQRGEYPNWDKLWKVHSFLKEKLENMRFSSISGIFVPTIGNIFIIKTKKIPLKKMTKFNSKYSTKLRDVQGAGLYITEYFYGGDNYEISQMIRVSDGSVQKIKYEGMEIFH
jgi:hypothetical protein